MAMAISVDEASDSVGNGSDSWTDGRSDLGRDARQKCPSATADSRCGLLVAFLSGIAAASPPAPTVASNGLKVGPEYGTPARARGRRLDPGRTTPACRTPPADRLVERLRRPHAHRADLTWPTSRTRICESSVPGCSRPARARRSPSATCSRSRSKRPRPTAASTSTRTCRSSTSSAKRSRRIAPRVLELVLRLQPELGARSMGPAPPQCRVDPTPAWMHRWRTTTPLS